MFRRLSRDNMTAIVTTQLQHLYTLLDSRKITLEMTPEALVWLADAGYDPVYGARPLKRVIQRSLQNPLAHDILSGKIVDGQTVTVESSADGLRLVPKKAKAA
jgi:ATP-dependent Clp protease ATP-binding subunit ClpB